MAGTDPIGSWRLYPSDYGDIQTISDDGVFRSYTFHVQRDGQVTLRLTEERLAESADYASLAEAPGG